MLGKKEKGGGLRGGNLVESYDTCIKRKNQGNCPIQWNRGSKKKGADQVLGRREKGKVILPSNWRKKEKTSVKLQKWKVSETSAKGLGKRVRGFAQCIKNLVADSEQKKPIGVGATCMVS